MNQTSQTMYSSSSAHLVNELNFYSYSAHLLHERSSTV